MLFLRLPQINLPTATPVRSFLLSESLHQKFALQLNVAYESRENKLVISFATQFTSGRQVVHSGIWWLSSPSEWQLQQNFTGTH